MVAAGRSFGSRAVPESSRSVVSEPSDTQTSVREVTVTGTPPPNPYDDERLP